MKKKMLALDGKVSRVVRLHQYPPVEWDGRTAWSCHKHPDGDRVLFESALVDCPECGSMAVWRNGQMRCTECGKQRLIG